MSRVVVTGIGAVTPVGNNAADTWEAVLEGRSGIGRITRFDASSLRTQIAAEVKDFSPSPYLSNKEARRMDPLAHYAASRMRGWRTGRHWTAAGWQSSSAPPSAG
jgi:3-oxoacyl-[acyl-carrier-protein] synthase II